ncbi:RagB/SusD family nutrient uptake outer membrane protein [Paraflavisolibacter sp. H34]|uniref:RagB/SusD family nutrient uptake outer membrane protein n=1 Tax=Huijunlia imazamoxiresistens TaxID=3127457 RepID=UPI003019A968
MKTRYCLALLLFLGAFCSCKKSFLDEEPLDFFSTSNAFVTYNDFNASVNNLYNLVRREFYNRDENYPFDYLYGTDLVFDGQPNVRRHTNMLIAYGPTGGADIPQVHWRDLFKIVAEANTVLSRIDGSKMTPAEKKLTEARAKFFRALGYRTLAYLYGGVPLVLEEVIAPQVNFTRATKAAILTQAIQDLQFAAANLPALSAVKDGEISNLAAWHLLSEVYLAAGRYDPAVSAASVVIGNPSLALMTARFGSRKTETPGDVYWDLFRRNNQNRTSGNTEGIWVIQFETDVLGGGATSTAQAGSYLLERHHAPNLRDVKVGTTYPFRWPVGDYTGGRGIGWAVSTKYFSDSIWQSDFTTDIRNANHNFVRRFVYTNPVSPLFGQTLHTQAPPPGVTVPSREMYAYQSKVTTPFDHPDNLYATARDAVPWELNLNAGGTYTDQYLFRLAETYLLRAEAYWRLGRADLAAADINVVRARARASLITPSDVTLDYILDERMRELGVEEKRRLTLMRLGLLYARVKRCNPYAGYSDIQPYHNLWPIPAAEIERNREGKMEQNPGYN